jgi:hypothetical protein
MVVGKSTKITILIFSVTLLALSTGAAYASGLTRAVSFDEQMRGNALVMQSYFDKRLAVRQGNDDLRDDIYEFRAKSPLKAFAFSLAVPGAGQFYNGSKIKAGAFFAVDALLWTGFLINRGKGSDQEDKYRGFADIHYIPSVYFQWWDGLSEQLQDSFSHRIYPDGSGSAIKNHEYYENIGKYDQFQVGWDDIGINHPPVGPGAEPGYPSVSRSTYLSMRKKANDYFSNASTMAMVSIANHLVSAFDAAIGAKKFNRGTRQYSLQFKSKNIDGKVAPFVVAEMKF